MLTSSPPDFAAAVFEASETGHVDLIHRETIQQLVKEESGKRIVKTAEIRNSVGEDQQRWKLAAEAELTNNFNSCGAYHVSTKEELAAHGRPLPMLCVWSQEPEMDYRKCRACVCGNFAALDPTAQSWTAQAEPSSLFAGLKRGLHSGWMISKHDVKGAFLNAKLPEGKLVVVSPPAQWVTWGLVPQGVCWTLDRAVYGLRESPALWSAERDARLGEAVWTVGKATYHLRRCSSDSQLWVLTEKDKNSILGLLTVYVDDFLLQAPEGKIRSAFLEKLKTVWTLTKEEVLSTTHPITFLGIEFEMRDNGDIFWHQQAFIKSLLDKYGMSQVKGNSCVQIDKALEDLDTPTDSALKSLQGYSGEFNCYAYSG